MSNGLRLILAFLGLAGPTFASKESKDPCPSLPLPPEGLTDPQEQSTLLTCAKALDAAGPQASGLGWRLVFADAHQELIAPEALNDLACSQLGLVLAELLVSPRYLLAGRLPEAARSIDHSWLHVATCVPMVCEEVFGSLALPRYMEWYSGNRLVGPIAPAGPCAVKVSEGPRKEDLQEADALCRQHLLVAEIEGCQATSCVWQLVTDFRYYLDLFGAQVRCLPHHMNPDGSPSLARKYAVNQLKMCKEGGTNGAGRGDFIGATFRTMDRYGYEIAMCMPLRCPAVVHSWWLVVGMGEVSPGVEISKDGLHFQPLAHRGELDIQWAIIGSGRCGTSSLSAWLGLHPQLELLIDETDSYKEGAFNYLFRRSGLEHLLPRDILGPPRPPPRPGHPRILRGLKEPQLLALPRGRQNLVEMPQLRLLIMVKEWIEWFK